ncbi:MAG: T9SS type A sorting domain-containing protein [Bacteroidales bacterium]|nr:T9SS type A sorting domain-containing protein [Bacteroidales bacterium]
MRKLFLPFLLCVGMLSASAQNKKILKLKIAQPAELQVTATGNPEYKGDSTKLAVTGGTPDYSFTWGNEVVTTDSTSYDVTVTDANNCTASTTIKITATPIEEIPVRLRVYPNPATDVIYVPLEGSGKVMTIALLNVKGQLISSKIVKGEEAASVVALSLNGVAPGTYFVRVTGNGKPITHSVIIK